MIEQPDAQEIAGKPSTDLPGHGHADGYADGYADGQVDNDQASELAQVRERLSFYESFDSLIRDNVLRSGELLRQVAAERERIDQQLLAMQAQLDQRLAAQRSALADIATGLAGLQANFAAVVDRLESSLVELKSSPGGAAAGEASVKDVFNDDGPLGLGEPAITGNPNSAQAATTAAQSVVVGQPRAGSLETENDTSGGRVGIEPVVPVRRTIDVIVHGVPMAATALSLQRHLQELRGVETVDVREYVSGVLRFQLVATDFGPDDLRYWPGADGLQTVTSRDNVLELRLVTTAGF